MTTPVAAGQYLGQHLREWNGKPLAVFNPHGKPVDELPVIYGFNNGGSPGFFSAVALSADGVGLGGHLCSSEGYMPYDLGLLEGTRADRHTGQYQPHYPDGYRMAWVPYAEIDGNAGLRAAFKAAADRKAAAAAPAESGPSDGAQVAPRSVSA